MLKKIISTFHLAMFVAGGVGLVGALGQATLGVDTVSAVNPATQVQSGVNKAGGAGQNLQPQIQNAINTLLFVIGVVAVIMIIIGGIKYTLSNGDSAQITSAKNTILYAVIGIVVALLAYAIVNFVSDAFIAAPATPAS